MTDTAPERIWMNMGSDYLERHGKPFVTQGYLAAPPYTEYVRADLSDARIAAAYEEGVKAVEEDKVVEAREKERERAAQIAEDGFHLLPEEIAEAIRKGEGDG